MNVTKAALAYSTELIKAKKLNEAVEILSWAEDFEKTTELGPVFAEQISRLKEAAKETKQ
jgi:hypothetical protein